MPSYGMGGTTVSTRNLISLLERDGYDCWVMPLIPQGLLSELFDSVHRIKTPFIVRSLHIKSWKYEPSIIKKYAMAIIRLFKNNFGSLTDKLEEGSLNRIIRKYQFNAVIACQEGTTSRVISKIKAHNKVAWVRCDYKRRLEDTGKSRDNFYGNYNSIVCVSKLTYTNFTTIFPEYISKTYCIPNPQDGELITSRAQMFEEDSKFVLQGKTLVSIGRFDEVKRFDMIASIAHRLCEQGLQFRWYLIGDGPEKERIVKSIQENHVEDYVIMLGPKKNPYYFIQKADVLVTLSRSEACPRVVNEAKVLHTPTVSTDFPTIYEFIKDGETGLIAPLEQIPATIIRLFSDDGLYNRLQEGIKGFSFDNTELIRNIESII